MGHHKFKVILEWNEEGGGYTVNVPALPGCISEGDDLEEALNNIREAITGYLEALKLKGNYTLPEDPKLFFGEVEVSS